MMRALSSPSAVEVQTTRAPTVARLIAFKPRSFGNSSLVGLATINFSGWIVALIPVFRKADGSLSVGGPNAAEVDGEGRQRDRDGKRQWWPVVSFANADARERWQRAVLAALDSAGVAP